MASLLSLSALILSGILIGLVIYIFYSHKKEPKNEDIILNGLSDYTNGYGLIISNKKEANKTTTHIIGSPRDIDYIEKNEEKTPIENQDVFVKKKLLIPFPISHHRKIYLALPDKAEQLPEELKETRLGKKIMEFIEEQNQTENKEEVKDLADKNILEMEKQTKGLELANESIKIIKGSAKDIIYTNLEKNLPKRENGE